MVWSYEIKGRVSMNPPNKRQEETGRLETIWGIFTNTLGDVGGEIDCQADSVLTCFCSNEKNANAIKIELNTATAGKVTITTTANDCGRFQALVNHR